MNVYLWIVSAVVVGIFYLGGFIYFFPSDKKLLEASGANRMHLAVDILLLLLFVACIALAIYSYTIINQQLFQYSR